MKREYTKEMSTRFAYVPMGATFYRGTNGTIVFTKVSEDWATHGGGRYQFELSDICRIIRMPPSQQERLMDVQRNVLVSARSMANEVRGFLGAFSDDIRTVTGNTNIAVLQTKLDDLDAALNFEEKSA